MRMDKLILTLMANSALGNIKERGACEEKKGMREKRSEEPSGGEPSLLSIPGKASIDSRAFFPSHFLTLHSSTLLFTALYYLFPFTFLFNLDYTFMSFLL